MNGPKILFSLFFWISDMTFDRATANGPRVLMTDESFSLLASFIRLNKKHSREYINKMALTSLLSGSFNLGTRVLSLIPATVSKVFQISFICLASMLSASTSITFRFSEIIPLMIRPQVHFLNPYYFVKFWASQFKLSRSRLPRDNLSIFSVSRLLEFWSRDLMFSSILLTFLIWFPYALVIKKKSSSGPFYPNLKNRNSEWAPSDIK